MKAVVAVDLNWGIGYRGKLLEWIPEDIRLFRRMTLGKVVIMGRGTFEFLPGKVPLKGRINLVLSKSMVSDAVKVYSSLDGLFVELKKYQTNDVFVIGGESVYAQLLPFCTKVHLTKIEKEYPADKHFVNMDQEETWRLKSQSDYKLHHNLKYRFLEYENCRPLEVPE